MSARPNVFPDETGADTIIKAFIEEALSGGVENTPELAAGYAAAANEAATNDTVRKITSTPEAFHNVVSLWQAADGAEALAEAHRFNLTTYVAGLA